MKHILLIEDDAVLRENTAELLELSNYKLTTAANGKIGIEKAQQILPDIIVCDIMMPEVDGYGVLSQLSRSEATKHIPFIFLSAKTERKDIRKGMDMGADDYLTKPFAEEELISAIESRLAKAAIIKEERESALIQPLETEVELQSLHQLKIFFDDNGKELSFNKEDVIFHEGQHSNNVFLVTKGVVKCYKLDEQGKELATDIYKEDDLFGYTSFMQELPYQETAVAMEDTCLVAVGKNELTEVLDNNPKLAFELIKLLADDVSSAKNQLLEMAYSSVHKKTATTILKFAHKINRSPNEPIKISRNDLASVAGIATETLIRTLSKFKKEEIIAIEGRNISILDLEALKSIH